MWTLQCELRSIQDRFKWVWTLSQSELRSILVWMAPNRRKRVTPNNKYMLLRGVAKPLWLGGCVHWIARICHFYKIAQILFDALTTTNVTTCDRIFPYFAWIFLVFKNIWGCDTPPVATPLMLLTASVDPPPYGRRQLSTPSPPLHMWYH